MAIHINNMDELAKALQPTMMGLVNQLADEVYKTLNYFLYEYYTGWTPQSYRRTEDFLRSAIKTEANKLINDPKEYAKMSKAINPYGDGKASKRIVDIIENYFGLAKHNIDEF